MTWFWVVIGFTGQAIFSARFGYQWIVSERLRRSVIPEAFWYISLAGGVVLLAYAIHRKDPVFIVGQAAGLVVYWRNIYLIWRNKTRIVEPSSGTTGVTAQGAGLNP